MCYHRTNYQRIEAHDPIEPQEFLEVQFSISLTAGLMKHSKSNLHIYVHSLSKVRKWEDNRFKRASSTGGPNY